jgi:hypothetical protein
MLLDSFYEHGLKKVGMPRPMETTNTSRNMLRTNSNNSIYPLKIEGL